MTFVSGLALRARLVSIIPFIVITGAADWECTFIASHKELAFSRQPNIIPTDLTNMALHMIQRLWLLQQQTKEKPTQKSLSVHSVAHTVLSGSLFLSLSVEARQKGRKDTVSLTLIHPPSIRFQNAIECGERKKESKMGDGRKERNTNTYALIIWSNHHELVSFMRACNQTSICFHCLQQSSICPQILQLSFFPGYTRQEA